jgi:hypothetical protein
MGTITVTLTEAEVRALLQGERREVGNFSRLK